ncbi:MAG: GNAT family N-acetyltransferase [Pirellula sp.]
MPVVYFKRYRMCIELDRVDLDSPSMRYSVPNDVMFIPWSDRLVGQHASAKWESFRNEIDAIVFPCLGDKEGCRQLMRDLAQRNNFVLEATWLAVVAKNGVPDIPAGTIQGLRLDNLEGAIQNVGVVPRFRGRGIGKSLLVKALCGFRDSGCKRVNLEVTIHNVGAVRLYESIGFQYKETVFKVGNVPVTT